MNIEIDALRNEGYFIAIIDGKKCDSIKSFLDEIGVAFKFPSYYGHNMNAFYECIADLDWLKEDNYVLVIKNVDAFLINDTNGTKAEFLNIFEKIRNEWASVPNYEGEDEYRKKSDFKILIE